LGAPLYLPCDRLLFKGFPTLSLIHFSNDLFAVYLSKRLLCLVLPRVSVLIETHDQREGGNALSILGKVSEKDSRINIDIHSDLIYSHLTLNNSED
jgi:hypothetical protein